MDDDFDQCEPALVRRAVTDRAAFQQLYEHYFKRVYGYVASRVHQHEDAEDLVSAVFLRVIQQLPQLRNQHVDSFKAWLFTIARNAITDHYRRKERSATRLPINSSVTSPNVLIEDEDATQIRQLIANLSERKREIIMLKYYGGLRNQDIATVLGIGEKTVAAYLSRALDELYEKYTSLDSEQEMVNHHDT